MKTSLFLLLVLFSVSASAQYYYKDIVGTRESATLVKTYNANKVTRVQVKSFDADGTISDAFAVEQLFSPASNTLTTITRSGDDTSFLISYADNDGRIIKTVDSSRVMLSTTSYTYDATGRLLHIINISSDPSKAMVETEEHKWAYQNNQPYRMLRIKNKVDTSFIDFKVDINGNVIEEQSTRRGIKSDAVYYYYDANNRLTDIVRFNSKAKRLLPEYMFEYSPANQVIQRITIPAHSSQYLIWRYQYNDGGLKTREAIYDKQKTLTGKIEYTYQRG